MKHRRDTEKSFDNGNLTGRVAKALPKTLARYTAVLTEVRAQLAREVALRVSVKAELDASIFRHTLLLEQVQAGEDRLLLLEAELTRFRWHLAPSQELTQPPLNSIYEVQDSRPAGRDPRRGNQAPLGIRAEDSAERTPEELHADDRENAKRLSLREAEVLRAIVLSKSNKETGRELGISFKTVEKHRQAVMNKLDIHDVAGLTRFAIMAGVIRLPRKQD